MYDQIKIDIMQNYEKRGKIIGEKSVDKYLNDIKKIQGLLGELGEVDDLSFLYNVKEVMSVVENMRGRKVIINEEGVKEKVPASSNTKRNYFQSIVSVFDALQDYQALPYYQKIVNDYNKEYKAQTTLSSQILTQESEDKLISFNDLSQIVSRLQLDMRAMNDRMKNQDYSLTEEDMNGFQMFLLLKLYMKHPARNEFATILYTTIKDQKKATAVPAGEVPDSNNYLLIISGNTERTRTKQLILNEYKTKGIYSQRVIELDDEIAGYFKKWRKMLKRHRQSPIRPGEPVFYSRFFSIEGDDLEWWNSPLTSNKLSKYFARFFEKKVGKSISTTALAKIVNSHHNKEHILALQKTSNDRGTSVGTLSQVYAPVLPA